MTTPVCDFVRNYARSGTVRLHMPGHKGRTLTGWEANDITEISGAGELYSSAGPVGEGEENTAALFGTAKTCWSTEGSSQCIRAMLALAAQRSRGKSRTVLAARNAHRSFLTACALLDLDVQWILPEGESYSLCACPVSADRIRNKLQTMNPLPVAVYLTSPDYLGGAQNIAAIAGVCHSFDVPLLVDNAHGAYLKFLPVSQHPMDMGADLCCDSAHKTLPALTGCAYLHVSRNAPQEFAKEAKRMLALFGSTSPSWLLLQSLDAVNPVLDGEYAARLKDCIAQLNGLKNDLSSFGWHFTGEEPIKLTLDARTAGYDGEELSGLLRKHGIECEYADPDYVVLMVTPFNTQQDLQALKAALEAIPVLPAKPMKKLTFVVPPRVLTPREAMLAPSEQIPVSESAGRVMAEAGLSCPPAVAVVTAGEEILPEHLPILHHYGIETVSVVIE